MKILFFTGTVSRTRLPAGRQGHAIFLVNEKNNSQRKMSGIGENRKLKDFLAIPKELAFSLQFLIAPLDKCPTNWRLTFSPWSSLRQMSRM